MKHLWNAGKPRLKWRRSKRKLKKEVPRFEFESIRVNPQGVISAQGTARYKSYRYFFELEKLKEPFVGGIDGGPVSYLYLCPLDDDNGEDAYEFDNGVWSMDDMPSGRMKIYRVYRALLDLDLEKLAV